MIQKRSEIVEEARRFLAPMESGDTLFSIDSEVFDCRSVGLSHDLLLTSMADFALLKLKARDRRGCRGYSEDS